VRRPTSTDEEGWTMVARAGVLVLAVALPLSTMVFSSLYFGGGYYPDRVVLAAWVLTAVFVPIHLGHVRHGLRDEAPPHGRLTFAVMVAVMVAGEVVVGSGWTLMFASLVASALLVFRPPWSVLWAVGVTVAGFVLGDVDFGVAGWYVTVVGAFRSTTLFGLVWFVAGVHRLRAARRTLADRAAARERDRVDVELLATLTVELERIEAAARRARAESAAGDVPTTRRELEQVTGDARAALAAARDVVADMRRGGSQEDLRAAAKLLSVPDRSEA
jgi:two-component system, NarL family, sensor histidine kinase DesK